MFGATANGFPAFVYGLTRPSQWATRANAALADVTASWLVVDADEPTTVVLTRLAGAVTSVTVYPRGPVEPVVAGATVTLTLPADTRLRVELNGDERDALLLCSQPPTTAPAVSSPWTDHTFDILSVDLGSWFFTTTINHSYTVGDPVTLFSPSGNYPNSTTGQLDGLTTYYIVTTMAQTFRLARTPGGAQIQLTSTGGVDLQVQRNNWTDTGAALRFPVGVHYLGRKFTLGSGVRAYLEPGAYLVGSFYVGLAENVVLDGSGTVSGEFLSWDDLWNSVDESDFFAKAENCLLLGAARDEVGYLTNTANRCSGLTFTDYPFYATYRAVSGFRHCRAICPWGFTNDGFEVIANNAAGETSALMESCVAFTGDNGFKAEGGSHRAHLTTIRKCLGISPATSPYLFGHFPEPESSYGERRALVEDCDAFLYSLGDIDSGETVNERGTHSAFRCFMSGLPQQTTTGRKGIVVQNCRVWGPLNGRLFVLSEFPYVWADGGSIGLSPSDRYGQLDDFTFRDVVCEETPGQLSLLVGYDPANAVRNIDFTRVDIGGVRLTGSNFPTFFAVNAYVRRLSINGYPMATEMEICNAALSTIGHAWVRSVDPPDGSFAAARCEEFFPIVARNLGALPWGAISQTVALTPVVTGSDVLRWKYAYEIPENVVHVRAVYDPLDYTPPDYSDEVGVGLDFHLARHSAGRKVVYSNTPNASAVVLLDALQHVGDWSPGMVEAARFHLAALLAGPLVKGEAGIALAERLLGLAEGAARIGIARDASESRSRVVANQVPDWFRYR